MCNGFLTRRFLLDSTAIISIFCSFRIYASIHPCTRPTMYIEQPVNQPLQQIDDNSWLFGDRILLTRQASPQLGCPFWGVETDFTTSFPDR